MRLFYFFPILLLFLVACGKKEKKTTQTATAGSARQMVMKVDGYIVRPQLFGETIEVPGSILANEMTEIHPEVSGRIVRLNVREGQFVSRGTLLAKLYDGDLLAQLNKLQVQLSIAQKTEERQAELLRIQGIIFYQALVTLASYDIYHNGWKDGVWVAKRVIQHNPPQHIKLGTEMSFNSVVTAIVYPGSGLIDQHFSIFIDKHFHRKNSR